MTPLVDFYTNAGTDSSGRTFDEVLALSDEALDASHDWVQWVFPLKEPSHFNPDAPVPTNEEIAVLRENPVAQANLYRAYTRFLWYLGLDENADGTVAPEGHFASRHKVLWSHFNHNYLRVTRFLASLRLFGQYQRSAQVCECLLKLGGAGRIELGTSELGKNVTIDYWTATQLQYAPGDLDKTLLDCVAEIGRPLDGGKCEPVMVDNLTARIIELRKQFYLPAKRYNLSPANEGELRQAVDSLSEECADLRRNSAAGAEVFTYIPPEES